MQRIGYIAISCSTQIDNHVRSNQSVKGQSISLARPWRILAQSRARLPIKPEAATRPCRVGGLPGALDPRVTRPQATAVHDTRSRLGRQGAAKRGVHDAADSYVSPVAKGRFGEMEGVRRHEPEPGQLPMDIRHASHSEDDRETATQEGL
jgi:hypothetical protein